MNAIPLVNNNSVNDINTSLIAIKKNLNNQGQLQDVDVNVGINIATNCTYCAASSTTIKGAQLYNGCSIKVLFTSAITGSDTTTPMSINYNDVSIPVKTGKNGVLSNFVANNIGGSYIYCQAYTTLELLFDGSQFIIMGNPVVISSADYTIYTDGKKMVSKLLYDLLYAGSSNIGNGTFNLSTNKKFSDYTILIFNIEYYIEGTWSCITNLLVNFDDFNHGHSFTVRTSIVPDGALLYVSFEKNTDTSFIITANNVPANYRFTIRGLRGSY